MDGTSEYHLFGGYVEGKIVGVAGVLIDHVLRHASHAFSDLVVDEPRRERGDGTELVGFVEEWADERDCESVALASPLAKEGVHEFYERRDYGRWGHAIEEELRDDGAVGRVGASVRGYVASMSGATSLH